MGPDTSTNMADTPVPSETPCENTPLITCDQAGVDPSDSGAVALLIKSSAAKALASLAEIKALIESYDDKYQATERALAVIQPRIEQAQQAFHEISNAANKIIEDLKETQLVELPVRALSVALARANATLDAIVCLAKQYDAKLKLTESLMCSIAPHHQRVRDAITDASCYATAAAEAATSQLQGVHAVISEQGLSSAAASMMQQIIAAQAQNLEERFKITENVHALAHQAANQAAGLANKYEVPDKVSAASSAVKTAVDSMEEKYAVSERMTALDNRVTGGRMGSWATSAFQKGFEMATGALEYAAEYAAAPSEGAMALGVAEVDAVEEEEEVQREQQL